MARKTKKVAGGKKSVDSLTHTDEAKRKNIPTAETQSFMSEEEAAPSQMRYPRNPDLDPQLVWRGKDQEDGEDLVVDTVPIYIQEKIHPRARSRTSSAAPASCAPSGATAATARPASNSAWRPSGPTSTASTTPRRPSSSTSTTGTGPTA